MLNIITYVLVFMLRNEVNFTANIRLVLIDIQIKTYSKLNGYFYPNKTVNQLHIFKGDNYDS